MKLTTIKLILGVSLASITIGLLVFCSTLFRVDWAHTPSVTDPGPTAGLILMGIGAVGFVVFVILFFTYTPPMSGGNSGRS